MTPAQLRRRETLISRCDAALERWPERAHPEFTAEMSAVAEALESLAEAMAEDPDRLERSRTWRWAGNAYLDLGTGGKREALENAARAYRRAERELSKQADPVEWVKLNYCLGKTLMQLSGGKNLGLVTDARSRFKAALKLARRCMPEGVEALQQDLSAADSVVALLGEVKGLDQRIEQLKGELKISEERTERAAEAHQINSLFGVLQQQFQNERPTLDPTRRAGLDSLMQRLGGLVQAGTREGNTLEEMLANRGQLEALRRELEPQVARPSLKGPGAAAGSYGARLLAAIQELKGFVGSVGMTPSSTSGVREAAMQLFVRLARLTTWISEAGDDMQRLHQLESDQARALAHEVRLLAARPHLMLIRPIWPHAEAPVNPNRVFFSGSERQRAELLGAISLSGLELTESAPTGADYATRRWHDLRSASLAVFDLGEGAPQVYYELGIALAIGAPLLLIAAQDTEIPFDVAQNVSRYAAVAGLRAWLADQVNAALYSLQFKAGRETSLSPTLAYAEQIAAAESNGPLLGVALKMVRAAGNDPLRFRDALANFNSRLGNREHDLVQSRWPPHYPDPHAPRSFAVMPFRAECESAYATIEACARRAGIEPVRGDQADGQQIIESIWDEICVATHVTADLSGFNPNVCLELGIADTVGRPTLLIGEAGTERGLQKALPSVSKRRCLTYSRDAGGTTSFAAGVQRFFAGS